MFALMLMITGLPRLASVMGELPKPVNVTLFSHHFIHLLTWEPGPGGSKEAYYSVLFKSRGRSWELVSGCEHVKHPLECNLTNVFNETNEIYYYQITTVSGDQNSTLINQPGFLPIRDTILDLPLVSVVHCGKYLCVDLQPPIEHMQKSYDRLNYELKIKSISPHRTEFSIRTHSLKRKIVEDVAPGRQYCVSVRISDGVIGRESNYSKPQCTFTIGITNTDTAISVTVCLGILFGLLILGMLFQTGFICLKIPLPPILVSISHRLDMQVFRLCDGPVAFARYIESAFPSAGRKENTSVLETDSEEETDMESTGRGGYELRTVINPLPTSLESVLSPYSCLNPHAIALQTDLFTSDLNQASPHLSPLSILEQQPNTPISAVIKTSECETLEVLAIEIIEPTDEEEEWSGQNVNLHTLTFGGDEQFSEEKPSMDITEEALLSSSDKEEIEEEVEVEEEEEEFTVYVSKFI